MFVVKKTVISVIIIASLTAVIVYGSGLFELANNCNVKIGTDIADLKYPVYMINDRIYVSLRDFCDELGIPLKWNDEKNEVEIDKYNKNVQVCNKTELKDEGVIPDANTALIIGKAILEKYAGKPMEFETSDKIYFLKADYFKENNSWIVYQTYKNKNGEIWAAEGIPIPSIAINKSNGEVLYINTDTFFKD